MYSKAIGALALFAGAVSLRHDEAGAQVQPGYYGAAPQLAPASNATVWRLRSGLNVAALSCRGWGRTDVTPAYTQVLARHRTLLAAAYRAEQSRLGTRAFESHQTSIYNRFAMQRSPEHFCRTAADVAGRVSMMDPASLRPASPELLYQLESGL